MNSGASWPTPNEAAARVLGIQRKLHRWAGDDRGRRFADLHNLVCDRATLLVAWERVRGNRGSRSAGIDGQTAAHVEQVLGVEGFLEELREQLRCGSFRPVPVKERRIPKHGGKTRRLGIPTVRDRVVQAALKLVLEPILEADFQPCSYGFRPRRRAQDAIAEIHQLTSRSYEWIVEADIEACFDRLDHVAIVDRVRARIGDKRVLRLVKAFLKAGILTEHGDREETLTGTPQGGILSPLLANIALSALDEHFARKWEALGPVWRRVKHRRGGGPVARLVRYADDFVVMVAGGRGDAEALRGEVAEVLAPLGLRLAVEKTRVCSIDEGFDFLGWHIQRRRKRGTGKHYIYTYPSKRAILAIRRKVRTLTRRTSQPNLRLLLLRVNAMLRGWATYFKHGVSKRCFDRLGSFAWRRVTRWLRQRHRGLNWTAIRRRHMHGWEIVCDGITLYNPATVAITRYRYRGARIPSPWSHTADTTARPAESRMR